MTTAANRRASEPAVVILVPYRPASDRHRWLWDMVEPHLRAFGWPMYIGTCEGVWKRAAAVNDAARKAGDWDVAFIADCDTIPDYEGILRAVDWVMSTKGAVRPHEQRYMLDHNQTITAVQRGVEAIPRDMLIAPWAGGGLDVVHREAWDKVGGMNEAYERWGWEDSEWHVQLVVHASWDRLPGVAYHLHHDATDPKPNQESRKRFADTLRANKAAIDVWAAPKGLRNAIQVL